MAHRRGMIHAIVVDNGIVFPDFVVRPGRVFYRADQTTDGVIELFTSWLVRPHRPER